MNIIHKQKPVEYVEDVVILKEKEPLPADAEWMGDIEVKGKANYNRMSEITRFKAWEQGANYVRIKNFGSDGVRSDIHFMASDIYSASTTIIDQNSVKVIDRNGNAIGTYNTVTGTQNLAEKPVAPLDKLGVNGFHIYAGYGHRLNKVAPDLTIYEREHVKRLKNGGVLGMDYIRYFDHHKGTGLGIRYHVMHASSADALTMIYDNGTAVEGVLNESVNISFFGPVYSGRFVSRDGKHLFVDNVGIGLLMYNDWASFNNETITVMGNTLGTTMDLNYSYFIKDNFSLGADISLTSGVIRKVTAKSGYNTATYALDESHFEGLVHLGVCAQLIYTF
ncbi:MAG: hypothetical protein IKX55_01050 [Bacteroidaceae bacterium]|nr:hypothetical protein [Bacteroidaceae bacterium]